MFEKRVLRERERERQTDRQAGRQAGRQADRQTWGPKRDEVGGDWKR